MTTTLPLGAGLQAAGTSPAGVGEPGSLGPGTGPSLPTAVRSIDPVARDYPTTGDGARPYAALTPAEQRVLLALATVPGSIAGNPRFGNRALALKKDDGHLAKTVNDSCRDALAALVAEGAVSFDGAVLTKAGLGTLAFVASWTDLARGQARTTPVGS